MQILRSCGAALFLSHRTIGDYIDAIDSPAGGRENARGTTMLMAIVRFLQAWKRYNKSLRELSRLGDRELADIGISRSDIPSVAWEAATR